MEIKELAKECHKTAVEKGWWNGTERSFGDQITNMHSELSEVWEAYRDGNDFCKVWNEKDGKPEGIPIEFADIIIRILDTCEGYGIDIEVALRMKIEYNKTRSYRHGGKLA